MLMECEFITEFFPASFTFRGDMIDLNKISIVKLQLTPTTFSCLLLQELALDAAQEVVAAESLTPIQQVSIIWARGAFDFDMPVDMGLRVIS